MTRIWHWLRFRRHMDEIIDLALGGEPQVVSYGDSVAAVILSLEEYERLSGESVDLSQIPDKPAWGIIQKARRVQEENKQWQRPAPGLNEGEVEIKHDFDAPLTEFDESEIWPNPDEPTG